MHKIEREEQKIVSRGTRAAIVGIPSAQLYKRAHLASINCKRINNPGK